MKTRLLRLCRFRHERCVNDGARIENPSWLLEGIGQLQPTLIHWRDGRPVLHCDGMMHYGGEYRAAWVSYDLRTQRRKARAALAEIEACTAAGRDTPARAWWRAVQDAEAAEKAA